MHAIRLSLLLLSSCIAVYLGYFHFDPEGAAQVMTRWGYWFILLPTALFVYTGWRAVGPRLIRVFSEKGQLLILIRRHSLAGLFLSFLWVALWNGQERGWKVVMDEPVLAATALTMHEDREASYAIDGYWINGEYFRSASAVDKRPLLFPFLVSVLHDLFGYDPSNAFRLNGILLFALLLLLFTLGHQFAPPYGGYLACMLVATVPVLSIVATSGIFDLLNLVLIVLLGLVMRSYLRRPSRESLDWLVLTAALLAYSRYESVLFALPVGAVVLHRWWREREVQITPILLLTPLLFVPYLLQRMFIDPNPANWHFRRGAEEAFSGSYVSSNVTSAFDFFWSFDASVPNSFLVSCLCAAAFLGLLYYGLRQSKGLQSLGIEAASVVCLGAVILFNGLLLMFYHWGQLDDLIASRLALPLILLQVMIILLALAAARLHKLPQLALVFLSLFFFFTQTRQALAKPTLFHEAVDRSYAQAVLDFAWERAEKDDLLLPLYSLPAYLGRASTLEVEDAFQQLDRIALHQDLGTFSRIFVIYIETTPLARTDGPEPIRRYAATASKIRSSFDLSILRRERINDALYLVEAQVLGIAEGAYTPLEIDFGRLEVEALGAISAESEDVWDQFTRSLPQ